MWIRSAGSPEKDLARNSFDLLAAVIATSKTFFGSLCHLRVMDFSGSGLVLFFFDMKHIVSLADGTWLTPTLVAGGNIFSNIHRMNIYLKDQFQP